MLNEKNRPERALADLWVNNKVLYRGLFFYHRNLFRCCFQLREITWENLRFYRDSFSLKEWLLLLVMLRSTTQTSLLKKSDHFRLIFWDLDEGLTFMVFNVWIAEINWKKFLNQESVIGHWSIVKCSIALVILLVNRLLAVLKNFRKDQRACLMTQASNHQGSCSILVGSVEVSVDFYKEIQKKINLIKNCKMH